MVDTITTSCRAWMPPKMRGSLTAHTKYLPQPRLLSSKRPHQTREDDLPRWWTNPQLPKANPGQCYLSASGDEGTEPQQTHWLRSENGSGSLCGLGYNGDSRSKWHFTSRTRRFPGRSPSHENSQHLASTLACALGLPSSHRICKKKAVRDNYRWNACDRVSTGQFCSFIGPAPLGCIAGSAWRLWPTVGQLQLFLSATPTAHMPH